MNSPSITLPAVPAPESSSKPRFHPLVEIFPDMEKHAFAEFVQDIKVNGVREPVTVYKNLVVDGRNRVLACQELGIPYPMRVYEGKESDLLAFVLSKNLHRRQMDASQRAMVAAKIANMTHGGDRKSAQAAALPLVSQAEAGKRLDVSERSVRDAVKVSAKAEPEVATAVGQSEGKIPVSAAAKIAEHPPEIQRQAAAAIAGGAKPAAVVRALPTPMKNGRIDVDEIYRQDRQAKASAPAVKLSKEQKKAEKKARLVYAALCRLEEECTDDGKALWEFAPSEFWPLLPVGVQEQVFHAAKVLVPWLTAIIAQAAPKRPGAIAAKPKLVKSKGEQVM